MKKLILAFAVFFMCTLAFGQSYPVDALFDKYSEREGFTSVYISGKMLGFLAGLEGSTDNKNSVLTSLKSIRILSQDSLSTDMEINFYDELKRELDLSIYEELMVVREGREVTKFLVRQKGENVSELLLISGSPGGNSLISIRGNINLKELSEMSKTLGIEELEQLETDD